MFLPIRKISGIGNTKYLKAFSLVELLVVITIISIMLAAGTVSYTLAQKKGRDGKRKSDLKAIQQSLEQYFQANGYYPHPWDYWCAQIGIAPYAWPQVYNSLVPTYANSIPKDPKYQNSAGGYQYVAGTSNKTYELWTALENTNDPEKDRKS